MLTKQQVEEAQEAYIRSKVSTYQLKIWDKIREVEAIQSNCASYLVALQGQCGHPLIARDYKNNGYNDDADTDYCTDHTCTICKKRWTTRCDWEIVGGKQGLPNDPEAKVF